MEISSVVVFRSILILLWINADRCSSRLDMYFNDKQEENNSVVTVTNEQNVNITCSSHQDAHEIALIEILCAGQLTSVLRKIETRWISRSVHIDVRMHGLACGCRIILKPGEHDGKYITIFYKTRPRLVRESINGRTVSNYFGENPVLQFDIYANPTPHINSLVKNGSAVSSEDYNATMRPCEKDLHYYIEIKMSQFDRDLIGQYTLPIDNGIEEQLQYNFTLKAAVADTKLLTKLAAVMLAMAFLLAVGSFIIYNVTVNLYAPEGEWGGDWTLSVDDDAVLARQEQDRIVYRVEQQDR